MESINSDYLCNQCKKKINLNNKLLHDQMCPIMMVNQNSNLDEVYYVDYIQNGKDFNNNSDLEYEYPSLEKININPDKNLNHYDKEEGFKHCIKCDNFLSKNEYADHLMCHNLEERQDDDNDTEDIHHNNEFHNHNTNINNNNKRKSNNCNEILQENDFDMIDDKDQILKEIEEDEIFKRKFEDKKISIKKSKNGIIKNTVSYLFNYKYRRFPPIVRIVGAIFDSRQLIRLAEDEIAARLVTRIIEGPSNNDKGDQEILLSLIPEIKMDNVEALREEKRDCIICGESYEKEQKISNLPCLHTFHSNCIKEWFKQKSLCPICKYEITKENFN